MGGGVGVEIREPLVVRADRWVREEGIQNLHYVSGNINVSIESLLAAYAGPVDLVSVSPSLCRLPFAQTRTPSHVSVCSLHALFRPTLMAEWRSASGGRPVVLEYV